MIDDKHTEKEILQNPDTVEYSVPAELILQEFRRCGVTDVVTVPDYVTLSVHNLLLSGYLNAVRVIECCSEDEAVAVSAGLYITGRSPVVIMQNQGLYASMNNIRSIGLEARIPVVLIVGQWGREISNYGKNPKESKRLVVRGTERLLEACDIVYFRLETSGDVSVIGCAFEAARKYSGPAAVLVGTPTQWARAVNSD